MRTVLVVDDEEPVRRFLRIALERDGLRVLAASDGAEAWRALEGGEPVDLVLTDVVMPELDGVGLAERVRTLDPSPRLVFMSAFYADRSRLNHAIGRAVPFVQKPFDLGDLVALVRRELGGASGVAEP